MEPYAAAGRVVIHPYKMVVVCVCERVWMCVSVWVEKQHLGGIF